MTKVNLQAWQNFLEDQEAVHILQTESWGLLKADFGWSVQYFVQDQNGVQLLLKRLPFGFHIAYIPMGPVGLLSSALLTEIRAFCRRNHTIFLKIEPDVWQEDFPKSDYAAQFAGMKSAKPIQPQRTILVDLQGSEADWLARMKQKTRYNIRLAEKKGVEVKTSESVEDFYALMIETGQRDGFGVHTKAYYQRAFDLFHPVDKCRLFLATFEDKPLAGVMIFVSGKRSWYFYGASNDQERNLMPTYLLQWEAMRYCAAHGCTSYDLWGIPDADEETLESSFMDRKDGLWSVYRFKRGFGGQIRRTAGAWDDVYINPLYLFYQWWINRHA